MRKETLYTSSFKEYSTSSQPLPRVSPPVGEGPRILHIESQRRSVATPSSSSFTTKVLLSFPPFSLHHSAIQFQSILNIAENEDEVNLLIRGVLLL